MCAFVVVFFFMQANCFHSSDARFFLVYGKSYLPKSFAPLLFLLGATELFHNSNGRRWRARFFFSFKVNRFVPGHVRLCCFYCVQMNCFIIATAIVSAREKGCSFKVNPFFPGFCAFVFFCGANELLHNNDGNRRRARFFRLR